MGYDTQQAIDDPARADGAAPGRLAALTAQMLALRQAIVEEAQSEGHARDAVHPHHARGATNLLHYLALRRRDLRPLQATLTQLGLSSLGRAESDVLPSIDAVLDILCAASGQALPKSSRRFAGAARQGQELLRSHTEALLGPGRAGRHSRIMVTMPSVAAQDGQLVHNLLAAGMDCARINCAHDDQAVWSEIIGHVRQAATVLGRQCRIAMDLGGPKLRTGPIAAGPSIIKIRPEKNAFGQVTAPARVWLSARGPAPTALETGPWLHVPSAWLAALQVGDQVRLTDTRARKRRLDVTEVSADGCWAVTGKTAYLGIDSVLRHVPQQRRAITGGKAQLLSVPEQAGVIRVCAGDVLVLTRSCAPGRAAVVDRNGDLLPATIGCTSEQPFHDARRGDTVCFDDGKVVGTVGKIKADAIEVVISKSQVGGSKLRAHMGINFPDTVLKIPALTEKDRADLRYIAAHADIVELSFPNCAVDVVALQEALREPGIKQPGPAIVLKIETRRGFDHLPEMLLTLLHSPICGVMIARGDLAVECGFERLAEVQEEIMWMCEAAHVPVIWATQVLESAAKKGIPSRAEITDAAMSDRAECVMLNKGPHIVEALRILDDILRRMQEHQVKKQAAMRRLNVADAARRPSSDDSA